MTARVTDVVFAEPSGRCHASVMFAGALVFLGLYAYGVVLRASPAAGWLILMAAGSALSGVAESLPADRRLAAGACRVAAILLFVGLLAATVLTPDLVFG